MIVQEIDLFKGIDPGIMNKIANICSEENYAKDTVLFKKGEEANSLYILEDGSVLRATSQKGYLIAILMRVLKFSNGWQV